MTQKAHVSDEKKKLVTELANLMKEKKTVLVASIKDIPASQFQDISKALRGKAIIKVPKKSLIFRAIDKTDKEEVKKLKEQIKASVAILFSDLDTFELASELVENKKPARAKTGQEAPEDIEIPAGPTDLLPGPAISELGALGIPIQVENGKISIKQAKIIVKKGEKISEKAAGVMNKLNIKPFSISFIPVASFDTQENKLYLEIKIDKEETMRQLKEAFSRALPFAVEIEYISKDTIGFLLQKAVRNEKALEKFEEKEEEKKEEKEEDKENDDKEEPKENVEPSAQKDESLTNTQPEIKPEGEEK